MTVSKWKTRWHDSFGAMTSFAEHGRIASYLTRD